MMGDGAIVDRLHDLGTITPWVTFSGGNPALLRLDSLLDAVHANGFRIAVETQGSVYRSWLESCDVVTISPKPPTSAMVPDLAALDRFMHLPEANLKVVVFNEDDFAFARSIHHRYPGVPFYLQVGNDLGTDTRDALLVKLDWLTQRTLGDETMGDAVVLPQLHVLLYGNRRGV